MLELSQQNNQQTAPLLQGRFFHAYISGGDNIEQQIQSQQIADKKKVNRQPCEIYSRVCGFLTPVSQWNYGKKEEMKDRQNYDKQLISKNESVMRTAPGS